MIGISVYLSDIDTHYLEAASALGIKYIFTSLHIPEENLTNIDDILPCFLEKTQKLNMSIIPDISPYTFEKLGLENNDFQGLKDMGFESVRLDFGFEDIDTVKEISKYFKLVLNASLVDEPYINSLQEVNLDLRKIVLMHNFYPKQDTGLSESYFSKLNDVHKKYEFETLAFVVGDAFKRLPLYEGLPTLEKHRDVNPYVAGIELIIKYKIDQIFIGDNRANINHLKFLTEYIQNNVITLPVLLDSSHKDLLGKVHNIRQDEANSLIRLNYPRNKDVPIQNNNARKKGQIVMDNYLSGRYSGEIQIIKHDLPYSSRVNNIGWVHPEYIGLLDYLDHKVKVKFVEIY